MTREQRPPRNAPLHCRVRVGYAPAVDIERPSRADLAVVYRPDPRAVSASVAIVAAVFIGVYQLTRPGALLGLNEYDDGVYLASSVRLVHGSLPYRDFAFPHPPGIPLLFAPFAWLLRNLSDRTLLGFSRVITMTVSVCNVALIAYVLRRRHWLGVLAASLSFAVFPLAVTANKALLLEPYVVFFVLAGVALVLDGDSLAVGRRFLLGFVVLGFALTVKLWAVLPIAVVVVLCAPAIRSLWRRVLGGLAIGALVPMLPFFLAAPRDFFRQVVTLQLERGESFGAVSTKERIELVTGFRSYPTLLGGASGAITLLVLFIGAVALSFVLRRRLTTLDWFATVSALLVSIVLIKSWDFYMHYGYFTAAFLALAGGCAVDAYATTWEQWGTHRPALRRAGVAVMAVAIGVAGAVGAVRGRAVIGDYPGLLTVGDPGVQTAAFIPRGSCVVADEVSLLLNADRLSNGSGCPAMIDSFYEWLLELPDRPPPSGPPYPDVFVEKWRRWFAQADYVVLSADPFRVPWSAELTEWFNQRFQQVGRPGPVVYRRVD